MEKRGGLYGIHIKVNVLEADKPRYRNRIDDITINVLGVVAPDMQFIYVLVDWEGSAADSSVVDPIDEIVDQNMLGIDGGINLHKKCETNGGEDIMLNNYI
ncbi:hypothetical protein AHAS_Ahas18G0066400 [Arachis hypogaea]